MKTKIFIGILATVLVASLGWKIYGDDIIANGCSKTCEYEGKDYEKATSAIVPQPGTQIGEFTKCPLSNATLKVTGESNYFTYKNEKYYTCCGTCVDIIKKNPEKYLN